MHLTDAAPSPLGEEPEITLEQSVRGGLRMAAYLAVAVVVTLAAGMIYILLSNGEMEPWGGGWGAMAMELAVVFASYFVAGVLGGVAFWLLRMRRPSLPGWVLTCAVLGATAMASLLVCIALADLALGVRVVEMPPAGERGRVLLALTGLSAVLGAFVGPFFWWLVEWRYRQSAARHSAEQAA